jgi:hypothetical protein
LDEVGEVVSASRSHVQQSKRGLSLQERIEDSGCRAISPEQAIDASNVAEGMTEAVVGNRKVVHPLLGPVPMPKVGKREKRGHATGRGERKSVISVRSKDSMCLAYGCQFSTMWTSTSP